MPFCRTLSRTLPRPKPRRRLLLAALLAAAAQSPAQEPGVPPEGGTPEQQRAFRALSDEFLRITARITELAAREHRTDAEARELEALRERLHGLSRSLLALSVPRADTDPLPPAPERPLPPAEEALRERAERLAAAELERLGAGRFPGPPAAVHLERLLFLDHPALGALLPYRFYLGEVRSLLRGRAGPADGDRMHLAYRLVVFDPSGPAGERAGEVQWHLGPGDVLGALWPKGRIAAPTDEAAARIPVAAAVLFRATCGATWYGDAEGQVGMTRAELDRKFGLGRHAGDHEATPHRVATGPGGRHLLTWNLHADDFDMPLQLVFCWQRFALPSGTWREQGHAEGPTFPPDTPIEHPRVEEAVRAFADGLAEGRGTGR